MIRIDQLGLRSTAGRAATAFIPISFGCRALGAILRSIRFNDLLFQKTDRVVVVFRICSWQSVQFLILLDVESQAFLVFTRPLLAHNPLLFPTILVDALAVITEMGSDSRQSLASCLLAKRAIQKNGV